MELLHRAIEFHSKMRSEPPSRKLPGKVETASLEEVNGVWLYTFDVRDGGRGLHRITIDAGLTGQVIPQNPNEVKRWSPCVRSDPGTGILLRGRIR